MKSTAAENDLSDSIYVDTVFKSSMRKRILLVLSPFAPSSFSVGLIEDDWTGFSSSVALKD